MTYETKGRGLTERELANLDRIAAKPGARVTDLEVGALRWFARSGNREEAAKANRTLARTTRARGRSDAPHTH